MLNEPAMPPVPAAVQTPVVVLCGVAEGALVLVVKGQAVKRQVTDAGVSPKREERVHPEAKSKRLGEKVEQAGGWKS